MLWVIYDFNIIKLRFCFLLFYKYTTYPEWNTINRSTYNCHSFRDIKVALRLKSNFPANVQASKVNVTIPVPKSVMRLVKATLQSYLT